MTWSRNLKLAVTPHLLYCCHLDGEMTGNDLQFNNGSDPYFVETVEPETHTDLDLPIALRKGLNIPFLSMIYMPIFQLHSRHLGLLLIRTIPILQRRLYY